MLPKINIDLILIDTNTLVYKLQNKNKDFIIFLVNNVVLDHHA